MPDDKNNKDAMSRALGAAFLSHQVRQLEKTVETGISANPRMNNAYGLGGVKGQRRAEIPARGRGGDRGLRCGAGGKRGSHIPGNAGVRSGYCARNGNGEPVREAERNSDPDEKERDAPGKDADVVIVDASVLIHAIGELKKWCRPKREEIVIVPLEALNTLDLLKKGTSLHAQRARAASRILEQQVGTNPRIRVQSDDAYVLWGDIPFNSKVEEKDKLLDPKSTQTAPEWLRCIVSCAKWEADRASQESGIVEEGKHSQPSVALAVCVSSAMPDQAVKHDVNGTLSSSPVPLPAPIMQQQKYEQRASGSLVQQWAHKAGIRVLEFPATPLPQYLTAQLAAANHVGVGHIDIPRTGSAGGGKPRSGARHGHSRGSSDEYGNRGANVNTNPINIARARSGSVSTAAGANGVGRPNSLNMKAYGPGMHNTGIISAGGEKIVERPAATMAMNASSILQPTRIVRVLARGEKLEP